VANIEGNYRFQAGGKGKPLIIRKPQLHRVLLLCARTRTMMPRYFHNCSGAMSAIKRVRSAATWRSTPGRHMRNGERRLEASAAMLSVISDRLGMQRNCIKLETNAAYEGEVGEPDGVRCATGEASSLTLSSPIRRGSVLSTVGRRRRPMSTRSKNAVLAALADPTHTA
jgi:hypothetical protein